jgi:predicted nucleic acid-binding protein
MSALILDAGPLVAVDRNDRPTAARLRAAERHGLELRSNAMVVAQVWRDPHGRQANLARLLEAVEVRGVQERDGRAAGVLQALARHADPIDATVVLLASPGDRILTTDPADLSRLAQAAGNHPVIVPC